MCCFTLWWIFFFFLLVLPFFASFRSLSLFVSLLIFLSFIYLVRSCCSSFFVIANTSSSKSHLFTCTQSIRQKLSQSINLLLLLFFCVMRTQFVFGWMVDQIQLYLCLLLNEIGWQKGSLSLYPIHLWIWIANCVLYLYLYIIYINIYFKHTENRSNTRVRHHNEQNKKHFITK